MLRKRRDAHFSVLLEWSSQGTQDPQKLRSRTCRSAAAERLELRRLRSGSPQSGAIFANTVGNPLNINNLLRRTILPSLERCEACLKQKADHEKADHEFKQDARLPEWHGWHAFRRGLGSNLYRLGVPEKVIQRILRHANVNTTATYYIKTVDDDVRKAMTQLESSIPQTQSDTNGTLEVEAPNLPTSIN